MVNKKESKEFFKSRGFYVSLAIGVIAVLGIGALGLGLNSINEEKGLTDLNEPLVENERDYDFAENIESARDNQKETSNQTEDEIVKLEPTREEQQMVQNNEILENSMDVTKDTQEKTIAQTNESTNVDNQDHVQTAEVEIPDETVEVISQKGKANNLSFSEEKGLLWPITGDIIMKYSMENGIYFQTLGQYKCNPAVMIQGEVGDSVLTASKCLITDVSTNEETGLTVTTSIGDDYEVVYGQLQNVNVQVGDVLEEGQVLGTLATPTKYYVLEGSNLYFKVLENGKTVNPMLLLR